MGNMEKEAVVIKNAPAPLGPYSPAVKVEDFVFVSGQVPVDPSTGKLIERGIEEQVRQSLDNVKALLEASGSSLDKVVKVVVFIKDMDDFQAMNKVYAEYFTGAYPARSCVQVAGLPLDARVEIEAMALT